MPTYPIGAMFITPVRGHTRLPIALGQLLCRKPSWFGHCGIVISPAGDTVEMQLGGARRGHIADYPQALVCDGPILQAAQGADPSPLRQRVTHCALLRLGTGYGVLTYLALALLHLGLPSHRVRARVSASGRATCSQLVDLVMRDAGIRLWDDDRLPGDVMPADLAHWAAAWGRTTATGPPGPGAAPARKRASSSPQDLTSAAQHGVSRVCTPKVSREPIRVQPGRARRPAGGDTA